MTRDLDTKLERFEELVGAALVKVEYFLQKRAADVEDVARARHILGHYRYGDRLMYEWSAGELKAAILEELADALNYACRLLQLEEESEHANQ